MAVVVGKSGSIYDGATAIGNLDNWSIDIQMDTEESTAFQATAKANEPIIYGWSGSMSGKYNKADAGQGGLVTKALAGTKITGKWITTGTANGSGSGFSGVCILSKVHVGSQVGKLVEFSADFTGDGVLTPSDTL